MYPFKNWKTDGGEFLGRQIHGTNEDFIIEQKEYAEKLNTAKISRERRREKDQPLTRKESTTGYSWRFGLVTATRPDLAAMTAKIQQNIQHGTVETVAET